MYLHSKVLKHMKEKVLNKIHDWMCYGSWNRINKTVWKNFQNLYEDWSGIHAGIYHEQNQAMSKQSTCVYLKFSKNELEIKNMIIEIKHSIDEVSSRPDKAENN